MNYFKYMAQYIGGGFTKTIDLSKYGTGGNTIGTAILMNFGQGGGSATLEDVGSFWEDVKTEKPMTLILPQDNEYFVIPGPIIYREAERVLQVSFTTMLWTDNGTYKIDVCVMPLASYQSATVVVKVS